MIQYHPEEFIGCEIKVLQGKNKSLEGIQGRIINETKNAFRIMTDKKEEKTVLKKDAVFIINKCRINGRDIQGRTEERIKFKK